MQLWLGIAIIMAKMKLIHAASILYYKNWLIYILVANETFYRKIYNESIQKIRRALRNISLYLISLEVVLGTQVVQHLHIFNWGCLVTEYLVPYLSKICSQKVN